MKNLLIANLLLVLGSGFTLLDMPVREIGLTPGQEVARPTVLARQIAKEQEKLRDGFERDLALGHAEADDWEERVGPLVKRAVDLASGLQVKDWQGEELRTLASIYYFAKQYALAVEACRKLLVEPVVVDKDGGQRQRDLNLATRLRVVQSLIELEQIDEAATALAELERIDTFVAEFLAERVFLHRDLAIYFCQKLQLEQALRHSIAGFEIGRRIPPRALVERPREARDFETARLAAMSVALLERLGQQKAADELQRRWRQTGRGRPAQAEATYEVELATQRLVGRPAPELEAKVWMGSSPLTSTALRGKVVLLHFWAMWNTASTSQFERLNQWQSAYRDRGFQVVGVTRLFGRSDHEDGLTAAAELASLESFKRQRNIALPLAVAGQDDVTNDERFNTTALPMFVLIDREGIIRRIDRSAGSYRKLGNEIDKLTAPRQAVRTN